MTTDRATLLALAARVEAAAGPDFWLECDIAKALDWEDLRPITASLDAAAALVPEGCRWSVEVLEDFPPRAWCSRGFAGHRPQSVAATPALALCAAALRARAGEGEA